MDNNVKIILGDGNVLDAVGISYIHIDASNKDYIFYSLNELANGNMDKIYIAEASQNGTTPGPISDEEWDNIKKIMLSISHNEAVSGITYKPLIGLNFNVGEAKKLAIKGDKKQAFIDAQNKAIAPTISVDEPAFVSEQAANGNPFFASDVNATGTPATVQQETVVPSAFAMNPPVEQEIPVESLEGDSAQPIVQTIISSEIPAAISSTETPAEQPAIEVAPVPVEPVQTVLEDVPAITPPQTVINTQTPAIETQVIEQQLVEQPVVDVTSVNSINSNTISNVDELKQAIEDVQNAINKINSYILSLESAKPTPVVVNTTQVQTISTGQAPVATESMNIADQPELKTDNLVEETVLADTTPGFVGSPTLSDNVLVNSDVVSTDVLNTAVVNTGNEQVSVQIAPVSVAAPEVNEEPAISIDAQVAPVETIDLNNTQIISTPNSASDINNSTVEVAIPAAPVVDTSIPQIPINPMESNGIPTVAPIAPVQPVVAEPQPIETISAIPTQQPVNVVQTQVEPVQQVVTQPTNVQTVPEIGGVQQVPIVDLSSINTEVTLPTDMVANPNPSTSQEGVLGPATLDAQTDIAA